MPQAVESAVVVLFLDAFDPQSGDGQQNLELALDLFQGIVLLSSAEN